jgi:hypothetical protein
MWTNLTEYYEGLAKYVAFSDILLLIVGGVISLLLSHFYYRKSLRTPRLSIAVDRYRFITEDAALFKGLEIRRSAKNTVVENPYLARNYIWNSGNSTIRYSDIPGKDPLRLCVSGGKALTARLISFTNLGNSYKFDFNKAGDIEIKFDFIEPNDGLCVEVLYDQKLDGQNSKSPIIFMRGTAIGAKMTYDRVPFFAGSKSTVKARRLLLAAATLTWGSLALFSYTGVVAENSSLSLIANTAAFIVNLTAGLVLLAFFIGTRSQNKIPPDLLRFVPVDTSDSQNPIEIMHRNIDNIVDVANAKELNKRQKKRKGTP